MLCTMRFVTISESVSENENKKLLKLDINLSSDKYNKLLSIYLTL